MTSPRARKTASMPRKSNLRKTAVASTTQQQHALASQGQRDTPLPLSSRAIFWPPRYLAPSTTLVHLPFLFWLVETTRPSSVVQLGLGDGVGFMGLCQAVDKLGLEAVCMGLELAQDSAGTLSEKLRNTHESLYSDFSFILEDEVGRAARHMRSAQVDLLVIDTVVDESFLTSLQAHWTPLLSDSAVVVLHAPEQTLNSTEPRPFYDDLLQAHPTISFSQITPGLDVILLGKEQPERLRQLAQLDLGDPGYLSARNVFMRLGQGIENSQQARSKSSALDKAKATLKEVETRLSDLERDYTTAQDQIIAAQQAEDAQITENGILQAQLFDLKQALEVARADSARADEVDDLRQNLQKRNDALNELQETLEAEQSKRKAHWIKLEAALAEKTALEGTLAQAEEKLKKRAEKVASLEKDQAQAQADAEARTAEIAQLQVALAAEKSECKAHWTKLEAALAEKSALESKLAQAQANLNAGMAETAQMKSDHQDKLKQSQDKRLALWEEHEALKLKHQALLRAPGGAPTDSVIVPDAEKEDRR